MWSKVKQLSHRSKKCEPDNDVTAAILNTYYASISTVAAYEEPAHKHTVLKIQHQPLSEWQVFSALDRLRPTAMGLDALPAWFLRLGAPFFTEPLTAAFNKSILISTIPKQWRTASIVPIPKNT